MKRTCLTLFIASTLLVAGGIPSGGGRARSSAGRAVSAGTSNLGSVLSRNSGATSVSRMGSQTSGGLSRTFNATADPQNIVSSMGDSSWRAKPTTEINDRQVEAPKSPLRAFENRQNADRAGQTGRQYSFNQGSFRPPRDGAAGAWETHLLRPGDVIDRHGGGRDSVFFSSSGTPFAQRTLPSYYQKLPLKHFKVLKPLPMLKSRVAAFPTNAPNGGGIQYKAVGGWTIQKLMAAGYLAPLD